MNEPKERIFNHYRLCRDGQCPDRGMARWGADDHHYHFDPLDMPSIDEPEETDPRP